MAEGSPSPIFDTRFIHHNLKTDEDFKKMRAYCWSQTDKKQEQVLYTDESFKPDLGDDKEWKRAKDLVKKAFFVKNRKHSRFDALQGDLGDCWLIAAIEAMTLNPLLANFVAPQDQGFGWVYFGGFHFRIWKLGFWYDVLVDDFLPVWKNTKKLCYAHSASGDVFWAALLEKAYAKVEASNVAFDIDRQAEYESLEDGIPYTSMQDLTGGLVERISLQQILLDPSIEDKLVENILRKEMMCLSMHKAPIVQGLIYGFHTYVITDALFDTAVFGVSDKHLVRLMNPNGHSEWVGSWSDSDKARWAAIDEDIRKQLHVDREDGEFWMQMTDMCTIFDNLYVCYNEPADLRERHGFGRGSDHWHMCQVFGEWVPGLSAFGPGDDVRHENPQYMFIVHKPKGADPDADADQFSCISVINITQRAKIRKDLIDVAYYVYPVESIYDFPFTKDYLDTHPPFDSNPDYRSSKGRSYVGLVSLKPGKFVVIPCQEVADKESFFVMRVFCECPVYPYMNYQRKRPDQIGSALPLDEENISESNEIPTRIFVDAVQGGNEMDWIGLKKVLQEAFTPSGSFFGKFASYLKNTLSVFGINIFGSSDESDNDDIVFTKDECRSMIAMLDGDHSGKLDISEFCRLWNRIWFWTKVYDQYKDEEEGCLKLSQLRDALSAVGYNLSKPTLHSLSYVYSSEQRICLTDFILCGVALKTVLSQVEKADVENEGQIKFTLDEWVKNTLIL